MARGKKTGGRDFQPGHPGMGGRPPDNPALKAAKKLTAQYFQECVNQLTSMTTDEVNAFLKTNNATMLHHMIAGQMRAGIKGKSTPMALLLDRTAGAVRKEVKLDVGGTISHELQELSEEQKVAMLASIRNRLEQKPD